MPQNTNLYFRPLKQDLALARLLSLSFSKHLPPVSTYSLDDSSFSSDLSLILRVLASSKGKVKDSVIKLNALFTSFPSKPVASFPIHNFSSYRIDSIGKILIFSSLNLPSFQNLNNIDMINSNSKPFSYLLKDAQLAQNIFKTIHLYYNLIPSKGASISFDVSNFKPYHFDSILTLILRLNLIYLDIFSTVYFVGHDINHNFKIPKTITKKFASCNIALGFVSYGNLISNSLPVSSLAYMTSSNNPMPISKINMNYYVNNNHAFYATFSNIINSQLSQTSNVITCPNNYQSLNHDHLYNGAQEKSKNSYLSPYNTNDFNYKGLDLSKILPPLNSQRNLSLNTIKIGYPNSNVHKNSHNDFIYSSYFPIMLSNSTLNDTSALNELDLAIPMPKLEKFKFSSFSNASNSLNPITALFSTFKKFFLLSPLKSVGNISSFYNNIIYGIIKNCKGIIYALYKNLIIRINQMPLIKLLLLAKSRNTHSISLFLSWVCAYSVIDIQITNLLKSSISDLHRLT
ncbi:hypothetical protein AYI69_g1702 [Smittium culicis]|uniref:Uncharacterized protein n=1 Tax=Smittium culicis TaxID=133412 RepID=A0A1R1YPI3_9FUNG|nr:hypothetical protein AYI69_g1702 [Smittium culicis]